jgi:hypothetical protein
MGLRFGAVVHYSPPELQDASIYDRSIDRVKKFETFDNCAMKAIDKMKRRFSEGYTKCLPQPY